MDLQDKLITSLKNCSFQARGIKLVYEIIHSMTSGSGEVAASR